MGGGGGLINLQKASERAIYLGIAATLKRAERAEDRLFKGITSATA